MNTLRTWRLACFGVLVAIGLPAHGALIDRGGGLIYDDVQDITWLADANSASTSGYDVDGLMSQINAAAWASSLVYFDSVRNVTYSDWRLPTALNPDGSGPCAGFNCIESEIGSLFYVSLGAVAGTSVLASGDPDGLSNFINIQSSLYWTGTVVDATIGVGFNLDYGNQSAGFRNVLNYAWAVRPGDVATVPLPGSWGLLGLGLVALAIAKTHPGTRRTM